MPDDLTHRQKVCAEAYLANGGVATEAALAAGYSPNTIKQGAHQVVHHPKVAAYIAERVAAKIATADEAMAELTAVAFAPWQDFIQVKYDKTGQIVDAKIMLADKVRALELIGKYHGLFREKLDVTHEEVVRTLAYINPFEPKQLPAEAEPITGEIVDSPA
jgi:phage terminase small subunit